MHWACYCTTIVLLILSNQVNGQRTHPADVSSKFSIALDWEQSGIESGVVITAASVSDCINRCYQDVTCKGFIWRMSCRSDYPKVCFLKTTITQGGVNVIGSISGYRLYAQQTPTVNSYGTYYGTRQEEDRRTTNNNNNNRFKPEDRRTTNERNDVMPEGRSTSNNPRFQPEDRRTANERNDVMPEGRPTSNDPRFQPEDRRKTNGQHETKPEGQPTNNDPRFQPEDRRTTNGQHETIPEDRRTDNSYQESQQKDQRTSNDPRFKVETTNVVNDTREVEPTISNRYGMSTESCRHGGEKTGLLLYPTDPQHKNVALVVCDKHYNYHRYAGTKHDQLLRWYYNIYKDSKQFQAIAKFFLRADGTLRFDEIPEGENLYYTNHIHKMDVSERDILQRVIDGRIHSYSV